MTKSRTILGSTPYVLAAACGAATVMLPVVAARADRVENNVAVFSALDKVTATIKKLEVPLGQTVQFGALKVTPRVCFSRSATEQPKTTSFVEVDEIELDGKEKRIFTGWMFAESPGLNAVEHPVFDVWLTECQKPKNAVASKAPAAEGTGEAPAAEDGGAGTDTPRRRVRR